MLKGYPREARHLSAWYGKQLWRIKHLTRVVHTTADRLDELLGQMQNMQQILLQKQDAIAKLQQSHHPGDGSAVFTIHTQPSAGVGHNPQVIAGVIAGSASHIVRTQQLAVVNHNAQATTGIVAGTTAHTVHTQLLAGVSNNPQTAAGPFHTKPLAGDSVNTWTNTQVAAGMPVSTETIKGGPHITGFSSNATQQFSGGAHMLGPIKLMFFAGNNFVPTESPVSTGHVTGRWCRCQGAGGC